jgi:hypothetical protein
MSYWQVWQNGRWVDESAVGAAFAATIGLKVRLTDQSSIRIAEHLEKNQKMSLSTEDILV